MTIQEWLEWTYEEDKRPKQKFKPVKMREFKEGTMTIQDWLAWTHEHDRDFTA